MGVVLVIATVAWAGGTFTDRPVTYRFSQGGTSLKVLEPDGFKIAVTMADGSVKNGTVPELFQLPEQDAFLKVTLTAPDGTTWSKKIEVRAKQQAELAVAFKADEPKPQDKPASVRSFVGKVENAGHTCGQPYAKSLKVDFLRSTDHSSALTKEIEPNTYINVELPSGRYNVRMFVKTNDVWDFVTSAPADVTKDGWKYAFGCTKRSKPSLVAQ